MIWIVAAWIMAPSCIPNYTHLPVPQSYTFRIYSYDCIFSYMLSLTTISKGGECTVAVLTVRNLSEETHRALRHRAAEHGRSTEAEVRAILEETVRPAERLKIGSELFRIAQEIGGMDDLEIPRDRGKVIGATFE